MHERLVKFCRTVRGCFVSSLMLGTAVAEPLHSGEAPRLHLGPGSARREAGVGAPSHRERQKGPELRRQY